MADPWAAFPDAPSADPWAAFPDAPRAPRPVGAAMSVNNPPLQPPPTSAPPAAEPTRSWSDVPGEALKNLLPSAGNFLSALVQPILHPVDTYDNLRRVSEGLVAPPSWLMKETPEQTATRTAPAKAVGDFYSNRYGSVEGFKNALATDPVGIAADASTVLSGGAMLPGRAGAIAGTVSRAIDPVTQSMNALKLGGKGAEIAGANALGMTTGAGKDSVRTAVRAGAEGGENAKAFTDSMRGNTPVKEVVETAQDAIGKIRAERGADYRSGMVDISKDRSILDFGDINKAVDGAGGVGKFKGANIEPAATEINTQLRNAVREWETLDPKSPIFKDVAPGDLTAANFHTPEGLDALKRTIGNIRDSTEWHTPERAAADRVYSAVRKEIVSQAPAYGKIMEGYEKSSDKLNETTRALSLGEKASGDTASRKLLSATRNNAQTNFGERLRLIDELAKYEPALPYQIAGQGMNSLAPRGLVARLAAIGTAPVNPFALPAFSPRIVGEGAYFAGKGAGMGQNALALMRVNEANVRRGGRAAYQTGREKDAR